MMLNNFGPALTHFYFGLLKCRYGEGSATRPEFWPDLAEKATIFRSRVSYFTTSFRSLMLKGLARYPSAPISVAISGIPG